MYKIIFMMSCCEAFGFHSTSSPRISTFHIRKFNVRQHPSRSSKCAIRAAAPFGTSKNEFDEGRYLFVFLRLMLMLEITLSLFVNSKFVKIFLIQKILIAHQICLSWLLTKKRCFSLVLRLIFFL